MGRLPQQAVEIALKKVNQKVENINQNVEDLYETVLAQCKEIFKGPKIKIEISGREINKAKSRIQPQLIKGKAKFTLPNYTRSLEVDCVVSCGHWFKLGEIEDDETINVVDHLAKLLPSKESRPGSEGPIGLVTFQNGMMNTFEGDFMDMSDKVVRHFAEGTLCIGLYNPKETSLFPLSFISSLTLLPLDDIPIDMYRFSNETQNNKHGVYSLCQMVKTLADLLPNINPNLIWVHFAHSEAGLIANAVLELCEQWWLDDIRKSIKKRLITVTYGAVKPIPDEHVLHAINTYSKNDIALFYGKNYIDKDIEEINEDGYSSQKYHEGKTYNVTVIDSTTDRDALVNFPLNMPERLTFEERVKLSLFESVAYQEQIDAAPWATKACFDKINEVYYNIVDHGFAKNSYQGAFAKNVQALKDKYGVHSEKPKID